MITEKIYEFRNSNPELLDYDGVIKITKSFISLSTFWMNQKELLQIITPQNFVFGFQFGVIVTVDNLLFVSNKGIKILNHGEIQNIFVNLNKMKVTFQDSEILLLNFSDTIINLFTSFQKFITETNETFEMREDQIINNEMSSLVKFYFNKYKNTISKINDSTPELSLMSMNSGGINDGISWIQKNNSNLIFECLGISFFPDHVYYWWYDENKNYTLETIRIDYYHVEMYDTFNDYEKEKKILDFFKMYPFSTYLPTLINKNIYTQYIGEIKESFDDFFCVQLEKYINRKLEDLNKRIEDSRLRLLNQNKKSVISILDKDGNGEVDLVDGESFNKLLSKHQKTITEIDKNYIQKFVKISIYLKTKRKNTQQMFDSIHETRNTEELDELVHLLQNQIHTYELLVFHSISMITSLVESDLITFYEIYESFDQLGVFNSNWENEVSNKLTNIGDGIKDLMYSINSMEDKIVHSLDNLTYITQDSFSDLNNSIASQLGSINSSINFNNLLTGIQTYQMYKINKNTKRIN